MHKADAGREPAHGTGAALAQLVEHIIRNDGVGCSNHPSGTTGFLLKNDVPLPIKNGRTPVGAQPFHFHIG